MYGLSFFFFFWVSATISWICFKDAFWIYLDFFEQFRWILIEVKKHNCQCYYRAHWWYRCSHLYENCWFWFKYVWFFSLLLNNSWTICFILRFSWRPNTPRISSTKQYASTRMTSKMHTVMQRLLHSRISISDELFIFKYVKLKQKVIAYSEKL